MACIKRASGSDSLLSLYICIYVLTSITLISGFILASTTVSADDTVDDVAVTIPVACTMSGTGMNSHTREVVSGTYESEIGTTTLKAFCNDPNGFAIYAIGYTGEEYSGTNHTRLVGANNPSETIATGTATSGGTSNWAMKLATSGSATYPITLQNGYGSYSEIPDTYTKVAQRTSGTDVGTGATGSTLTTTYAAYMSSTQAADTYAGKVKYTMVHPYTEEPLQPQPATAGCINYFANGSSVTGQMGCQRVYNNTEVTLWASNFKRPGYGFAGWNTEFDYSGTYYGPNQTITIPSDVSTNGLSLYAVWVKSAGTLQNWSGCSSLAQGSVTALTDNRDDNTYAVAKLADGKCWMIENLRLDDSPELSSANTHNPSLPLNNSWYYKNQQGTLTTSNHLSATSDPTSTSPDTAWCQTNSTDCDDQSMLSTNNTTLFTNNTASSYSASSNAYSYGNYYNWYSATAGHGKYGSSYGNGYHAPGDICPTGWYLPKGGNKANEASNEFWSLIVTGINNGVNPANYDGSSYPYYNDTAEAGPVSNALRSYPNNFVYSGRVNGSSVDSRDSFGYYWSASGYNSNNAYILNFSSTYVYPGTNSGNKYSGRMVRCLSGS